MTIKRFLKNAERAAKKSGLTYQQIGERMGYPKKSARASVNAFLHGKNPTLASMLRFCKAIEIELKDLL
jgi:transcriptional regulator with XRE-family HTH domain